MLEKILAVFVIGMKGNTLSTLPITMLLKTGLNNILLPIDIVPSGCYVNNIVQHCSG
jgi:hypothetical protein